MAKAYVSSGEPKHTDNSLHHWKRFLQSSKEVGQPLLNIVNESLIYNVQYSICPIKLVFVQP